MRFPKLVAVLSLTAIAALGCGNPHPLEGQWEGTCDVGNGLGFSVHDLNVDFPGAVNGGEGEWEVYRFIAEVTTDGKPSSGAYADLMFCVDERGCSIAEEDGTAADHPQNWYRIDIRYTPEGQSELAELLRLVLEGIKDEEESLSGTCYDDTTRTWSTFEATLTQKWRADHADDRE